MPPKRNQKGSNKSSKAPSKVASKAPSGASTPALRTEPQTPVKLAPGLVGLTFGQSFSSVAVIDKVRTDTFYHANEPSLTLGRAAKQEGLADCIANDDGERQIATALSFSGSEFVSPSRGPSARSSTDRHSPCSTRASLLAPSLSATQRTPSSPSATSSARRALRSL